MDELQIPGMHNLENVLAAAGAAISFGVDPAIVADAIRAFRGVVHRMEPVATVGGVLYVNNSMCTNVDAAVRSLEAMSRPYRADCGRGADKKSDFTQLGAVIGRAQPGVRRLILIGQAAPLIETAARDMPDMRRSPMPRQWKRPVRIAASFAEQGDAVMLSPSCASFDMFADFEARGEAFRQAVRSLQPNGIASKEKG